MPHREPPTATFRTVLSTWDGNQFGHAGYIPLALGHLFGRLEACVMGYKLGREAGKDDAVHFAKCLWRKIISLLSSLSQSQQR